MPENYAPFFVESGTDIQASKYVSKLLKRSVKQISGTQPDPETETADASSAGSDFSKLTKLIKSISAVLDSSLRRTKKGVAKRTTLLADKDLLIRITGQVNEVYEILSNLKVEYLSKPQVAGLKKLMEKLYLEYDAFKENYDSLVTTGRVRNDEEEFIVTLMEDLSNLFPVAQALLDSEGVIDVGVRAVEPTAGIGPLIEGGCHYCEEKMTGGYGYSPMPFKRFL